MISSQASPQKRQAYILTAILLITAAVFSPVLRNGWVNWDDDTHVLNNASIKALDLDHLRQIFTQRINHTYIPLTSLSFALEYHWAGLNPFWYHLDNLLLYLLVVALVFLCARRLGLSLLAAGIGTMFFSLHPMRVESVAWITERKDLLYAAFYLSAIFCYLGYLRRANKFSYALTILWCFLSLLSKPMAISLPIIFFLIDWYQQRPLSRRLVLEKVPHMAIILIQVMATCLIKGVPLNLAYVLTFNGFLQWVWCLGFSVVKFFVPISLMPIYQTPRPVFLTNPSYLAALLGFILVAWSLFRWRTERWYLGAWGYYFFSIFFVFISILAVSSPEIAVVTDRYLFLPSLGFCLLLGMGFEKLSRQYGPGSRRLIFLALMVIWTAMGISTVRQISVWHDSETLWKYELSFQPARAHERGASDINFAVAHNNLGQHYRDQGRMDEALSQYDQALAIFPRFAQAHFNRGKIFDGQGKFEEARVNYTAAINADPAYAEAYNERGIAYGQMGKLDEAMADFKKALAIEPGHVQARTNLAYALSLVGE